MELKHRNIKIIVVDAITGANSEAIIDLGTVSGVYMAKGENLIMDTVNRLNDRVNRSSGVDIDLLSLLRSTDKKTAVVHLTESTKFCPVNHTITIDGVEHKLGTKSYGIMRVLCDNLNQMVPFHEVVAAVWGTYSYGAKRSYDVYVAGLRKILKSDRQLILHNVHGSGNKLVVRQ